MKLCYIHIDSGYMYKQLSILKLGSHIINYFTFV